MESNAKKKTIPVNSVLTMMVMAKVTMVLCRYCKFFALAIMSRWTSAAEPVFMYS